MTRRLKTLIAMMAVAMVAAVGAGAASPTDTVTSASVTGHSWCC